MAAIAPYIALALQTTCYAVNDAATPADARARMVRAIERVRGQIAASKRFVGSDVKLVVLPEYFLTGFPMGETIPQWAEKAAIDPDGSEHAAIGRIAKDLDVWISGNAYERDPHFPGLYFQTSFLTGPEGHVVLRYRRLISLFAPSPWDLFDRYVQIYGRESIFPVADTPLGRMAAIASEEILYPEIARALALNGAEVFLHSSSEIAAATDTPKNVAKQARAIENLAYVVSANSAGIENIAIPKASTDASSKVIDYRGLVLAEAGYGESMAAYAEIDVEGLRRYRRRPGMGNILSRLPTALFAEAYAATGVQPKGSMQDASGRPISPDPAFFRQRQQRVIEALVEKGIV